MPVPTLHVLFVHGSVDLAPLLSQETNATISALIEDPTGTNEFMAGDVTLKGYDVPNGTTVRNLFANITPLSTDYLVLIGMSIVPPEGSVSVADMGFLGYIAPNTVQFEPRTGAFSFTVIGLARNLQTTSAATLFKRAGYTDGKWILHVGASTLDAYYLQIARADGVGQTSPDFLANDQIQIGTDDKLTIVDITPDTTSPPTFWTLLLTKGITKNYPVGQAVNLLTPYQRNLALHDVVRTLFLAAGFSVEKYFFSAALPNLAGLFASPISVAGLPSGFANGIAVSRESGGLWVAVSAPTGAYYATGPSSGFTFFSGAVGFQQPPVDSTNYGTVTTMFGLRRERHGGNNPRYGLNVTMKFYGYDHLAENKRYVLTVTCNADVPDGDTFVITTSLAVETCTNGVWVWGSNTPIAGVGISTTTTTDLSRLFDAIGIDVDPATGTVFFTDIQSSAGAGSPITMNTSSYQPGGAGYVANRQAELNGPIMMLAPNICVVFQTDGILGKDPTVSAWTLSAAGAMTPYGLYPSYPVSPYIVANSLRRNPGDGRFYALISDPTNGVSIISSGNLVLIPDSNHPPSLIAPPPYAPAQSTSILKTPFRLDLVVQYGVSNGADAACPMFALIGGTPVYVSNKGSGFIPYADMTDLSVADALQQLSVAIAGIFYIDSRSQQWVFRSRSSPMPGDTIGTNDQIDGDPGFISVLAQPVSNKWVGYVSVAHENDETIFGDTSDIPGSSAYANADGLNLQLKSRFVTSAPFATALAHSLYNYLGAKKRWIEVNRFRDGRLYEIGRTFRCNVEGANRQVQIIEADAPVCGVTVKVMGLEV